MVDEALILRKLSEIEEYLEQIREYSDITVKEYCDGWKIQRIIERTLPMLIEICVDIAGHIISDKESFAEPSILFEFKEGKNLNHRNILNISRIKI